MTILEAIFLGIVQGVTEFLPVSSSGHLVLAEHFLNVQGASIAFDVTLHIGTLLAVLIYFRTDWLQMGFSILPGGDRKKRRLFLLLAIGTIPGALLGYLLEDLAASTFRSPWIVVVTLTAVAFLMILAERISTHMRNIDNIGVKDALAIGCAQALAIVPGVSRSGITMTVGLFLKLDRPSAARFSFLLSAPIIAGAGLYETMKLLEAGGHTLSIQYLAGFTSSFFSGYGVIFFLMRYLEKHTFYPFAYYRMILAALVATSLLLGF